MAMLNNQIVYLKSVEQPSREYTLECCFGACPFSHDRKPTHTHTWDVHRFFGQDNPSPVG